MLLQMHDKRPYASTPEEIAELARELRDANYRIETSRDGVHIFAKHFHAVEQDAMALFPHLDVAGNVGYALRRLAKADRAARVADRVVSEVSTA